MKHLKSVIVFSWIFFAVTSSLSAHERREVGTKFEWIVGFLNEPAFSGQINGVDLRIAREGLPVEGAEKTLRVLVRKKDREGAMALPLRTRYKQPGAYAGDFIPVEAGGYEFEISGTLENEPVHEVFRSGEKFGDVKDAEALKFPSAR